MSLGPTVPIDPLELLNNTEGREKPLLSQYYIPVVGGLIGFVGVALTNWATKKPMLSGLYLFILLCNFSINQLFLNTILKLLYFLILSKKDVMFAIAIVASRFNKDISKRIVDHL